MNRFIIVDGLPYLYADHKAYAVRWDDEGFTVGAEVKMASAPDVDYSELSVLAKCQGRLDSIKATTPKATTPKAATPKAATPKAATPKAATRRKKSE